MTRKFCLLLETIVKKKKTPVSRLPEAQWLAGIREMAMENVFRVKSSDLFCIKSKLDQFKKSLRPTDVPRLPTTYDDIRAVLGIESDEQELQMEDAISLERLADPNDLPVNDFNVHDINTKISHRLVEIPCEALGLKSVQSRVDHRKEMLVVPKKYNKYHYLAPQYDNTIGECDLKPFESVVIVVRVYEPFLYIRGVPTMRLPRLSQEFLVLGTQHLSELRDKIYCQCQFGPFHDISEDFEEISRTASSQIPSSSKQNSGGVFFITDTFYKDDDELADQEFPFEITEWMARQPEIGKVSIKSMRSTKFEDLSIRLGYPQLYRHYENCEHVVVVADVRLLATSDSLKSADYPMLRCVSSTRNLMCMICGINEAAFLVRNTNVHLQDPTYLCQNCFISYHYIDGQKNGHFQAYRYYGNRPIPNQ